MRRWHPAPSIAVGVAMILFLARMLFAQGLGAGAKVVIGAVVASVMLLAAIFGYLSFLQRGMSQHEEVLWHAKALDVDRRTYGVVWLTDEGFHFGKYFSYPSLLIEWSFLYQVVPKPFQYGIRTFPVLQVSSGGRYYRFGLIQNLFGYSERRRDECIALCVERIGKEWPGLPGPVDE